MGKEEKDNSKKRTLTRRSIFLIVSLILSLGGTAVGVELTTVHYRTHTDPGYHSVCAVNEQINCETVAQSPFSVFAGVPVSVLAIFAYTVIAILAASGLSRKRLHPAWPNGVLFWAYVVAFGVSALLGYISWKLIDSICVFCLTLYLINIALFVSGIVSFAYSKANPVLCLLTDLKALFTRHLLAISLIIISCGTITALVVFIPPYWRHPGWSDLPKLPTGQDEQGCHWIGAENPLITVVEFSDYQCPYCRQAHKQMRMQAAKHPDTVRLIHNHFPLDQACNDDVKRSFHDRACEFSKAAECAAEQDMFWPMNDALFSIQESVRSDNVDIERIAVQLGLDRSAFKECMSEDGISECIQKDLHKARQLKVKGTPTFFIRSQPYPGGIPSGVLEKAIEQERKKKK
jgi:uncharacterized membrane protein/predicted DsbA family dithiol-disulfide isomerase